MSRRQDVGKSGVGGLLGAPGAAWVHQQAEVAAAWELQAGEGHRKGTQSVSWLLQSLMAAKVPAALTARHSVEGCMTAAHEGIQAWWPSFRLHRHTDTPFSGRSSRQGYMKCLDGNLNVPLNKVAGKSTSAYNKRRRFKRALALYYACTILCPSTP
jgi:hypothetical protein